MIGVGFLTFFIFYYFNNILRYEAFIISENIAINKALIVAPFAFTALVIIKTFILKALILKGFIIRILLLKLLLLIKLSLLFFFGSRAAPSISLIGTIALTFALAPTFTPANIIIIIVGRLNITYLNRFLLTGFTL